MKTLLSIITLACLSACTAVNYKDQVGSVEIQVEQTVVLAEYRHHLADFYQLMSEGLEQDAIAAFTALQTEFYDTTLPSCEQDESCLVSAYETHFEQLHHFIYKHQLSNVEDIYVESYPEDQHLITATGFYGFVGDNHERLALFIDELEISRNENNNPYGIERIQSIDAILYGKSYGSPAQFIAMGEHPLGKVVRISAPLKLKSLFYSLDISEIDFTQLSIGISVHLVGHEYEITTTGRLIDVRDRLKAKQADKVQTQDDASSNALY